MAAQKRKKKKLLAEIFCIFECLLAQNPTNQIHNSLDSSRPCERLWENKKIGALESYSYLKIIAELAPQKIFQKNI